MEKIIVKEPKLPLILGIIGFIIFFVFFIFSLYSSISKNDIITLIFCSIVFGSFLLLSIYLITSYFRRKLILYENYFTYTKTFKKTKTYEYNQISSIQTTFNNVNITLKIYIRDKKIVSIENNMIGFEDAIDFFNEKNLNIKETDINKYGNKLDKINQRNKNNKQKEENYIKHKWTKSQIKKEINFTKIFNIFTIICFVVSLFLPLKIGFSLNLLILLFCYALYLYFYPKMVIEIKDKSKAYRIPLPFIPVSLIIVHFLLSTKIINESGNIIFLHALIFTVIMLIPFIITVIVKRIKPNIVKIIVIFIMIFAVSFSIVRPINYILTLKKATHETVTVIDKHSSHSGKSGTHCYFDVILKGEKESVEVSKSIYKEVEINDNVQICNRESILGYKYFTIHK